MINKDYIDIDYMLFYNFCRKIINIEPEGLTLSSNELNIKDLNHIFRRIILRDYNNNIFICFDYPIKLWHDFVVVPFEINYFNNIIKPKFDKYLKLRVFI